MRDKHSRPEVLHGVELGDPMQVVLPGSAAVILEEPQSPIIILRTKDLDFFFMIGMSGKYPFQ